LRWIHFPTSSINIDYNRFVQVESHVAPCLELLCGIEQDLPTHIALCQSSDVVHEGNIVELFGLFNAMG
jgi:hypothetical protein